MTQVTLWKMQEAEKSKTELIRAFAHLTPTKIVDSKFPSVGALVRNKKIGLPRVEQAITLLLDDLNESVGGALKSFQIEEVAVEITSDHILRSMSLEDIYYALRKLKIENSHGSISLNKVLKTLRDHNADRMAIVQRRNENNHLAGKYEGDRSSEELNKVIDQKHTAAMRYKERYFKANKKLNNLK